MEALMQSIIVKKKSKFDPKAFKRDLLSCLTFKKTEKPKKIDENISSSKANSFVPTPERKQLPQETHTKWLCNFNAIEGQDSKIQQKWWNRVKIKANSGVNSKNLKSKLYHLYYFKL